MTRAVAQLGTTGGVDIIYAAAKSRHHQRLSSLGIIPLTPDPVEWYENLKERLDLVVSFEDDLNPMYYKLLNKDGQLVVVTQAVVDETADHDRLNSTKLICRKSTWQKRSRTHTYDVFHEWEQNLTGSKKDLQHLIQLLASRKVTPTILERIPLSKVPRAHELTEAKRIPGFIVCEPWLVNKWRAVRL